MKFFSILIRSLYLTTKLSSTHPQKFIDDVLVKLTIGHKWGKMTIVTVVEEKGNLDMEVDGHVLVIGASGFDIKGRSHQELKYHADNPGKVRSCYGGVGRNIAENLARLDIPTVLLTAVGDDAAGDLILAHLASAGVNVSHALQLEAHRTGNFIAVLNEFGDLALAVSDFEIMAQLDADYIASHESLFAAAQFVMIDLNIEIATIDAIIQLCQKYQVPLCCDPTSPAHAQKIVDRIQHFYLLTPNASEIEVFCRIPVHKSNPDSVMQAVQYLVAQGVKVGIVTLGENGAAYATANERGMFDTPQVSVVDSTGAGDALSAGVIFGLVNQLDLGEALRLGMAAARLTLGSTESVLPDLSPDLLYEQLI